MDDKCKFTDVGHHMYKCETCGQVGRGSDLKAACPSKPKPKGKPVCPMTKQPLHPLTMWIWRKIYG